MGTIRSRRDSSEPGWSWPRSRIPEPGLGRAGAPRAGLQHNGALFPALIYASSPASSGLSQEPQRAQGRAFLGGTGLG